MPDDSIVILALAFILVGAMYGAVGHAGASGYLAIMSLMGVQVSVMRPTALAINVLVATIAFVQFYRGGYFSWRICWPFAIASAPAAFLASRLEISASGLKVAIGATLLCTAAWMANTALRPRTTSVTLGTPSICASLASGAAIGVVSGITGTGGGIFLSPLMLLMQWGDNKRTAAVASMFILCNSIAGLCGLATSGWTPSPSLAILAVGACAGGAIGAHFGSRVLDFRALRLVLCAVLIVAGAKLVLS